jgi:hypothetical protein
MRRFILTATLAFAAGLPAVPALAQASPPPPAAAPDPVRLAAARTIIDTMMPPAQRDDMLERMARPMMENMRSTMMSSPMFAPDKGANPKMVALMDSFTKDMFEREIVLMKAEAPALFDAMARAYARRFSLADLKAIGAFFETPAGRTYAAQAPTIMTDPDVLSAQRNLITKSMAAMQDRLAEFTEKMAAENKAGE